jgi:hypothetical protein
MTELPPPTLDRRSGADRRTPETAAALAGARGRDPTAPPVDEPTAGLAAPFTWTNGLERRRAGDPWAAAVARAVEEYRAGHIDELARCWDDALVWRVTAGWPGGDRDGAMAVFAYHRELRDRTDGTFRQEILSIDASGGPIVTAHVRTTATAGARRLDVPSLLTFELVAMRVQRVTEIPGDRADWDRFWST